MVEDLFKKEGGNTKPLGSSENVEKDLVHGLLKALYDEYPNYVPLEKLIKYQNILTDFSGIIMPSIHKNSENSHKPEFLAEAALVQLTHYIERQNKFENYRITAKGIELLNAINLNKSSRNLENLSSWLLKFTVILGILATTSALSSIYTTTGSMAATAHIFLVFFVTGAFIFVGALILYKLYTKTNK